MNVNVNVCKQINVMALFENLNAGVVYVLPSMRLFRSWHKNNLVTVGGLKYNDLNDEEFSQMVDWYREDLKVCMSCVWL